MLIQNMHASDPAAVPALAHTIKGSALGTLYRFPDDKAAMLSLKRAVEEARAAIASMLAPPSE